MTPNWDSLLRRESAAPYWTELRQFVDAERSRGTVYPPPDEVYAALELTPFDQVKVVILGQDPYPSPGEAHGLCFSVRPGIEPPDSLRNIFKELDADLGFPPPNHGCLEHWAHQGVLLLNTSLTVRAGERNSHVGRGWETFTDRVLGMLSDKEEPTVFVLWGNPARRKKQLIADHHHIIESPHPSPLSAYKGFFGSKPFSRANAFLVDHEREAIDWQIPVMAGTRPRCSSHSSRVV